MRFDLSNFNGLAIAVDAYRKSDMEEALVLVIQTPGGVLHRFIISKFGIEKELCDKTGGPA